MVKVTSLLNSGADVDTVNTVSYTIDTHYYYDVCQIHSMNDVCLSAYELPEGWQRVSNYEVEWHLILKAFSAFSPSPNTFVGVVTIVILYVSWCVVGPSRNVLNGSCYRDLRKIVHSSTQ